MNLRVLGVIEVEIGGGVVHLGNGKELAIFAVLGLAAGRPVPAETLADQVWDGAAPGRSTLHANISRLRRKLTDRDDTSRYILERSGAYILDIEADSVDWLRFQRLYAQASALIRAGDDDKALTLLHQALRLWRGTPLTGIDSSWAEARRTAMRKAHASAMTRWADTAVRTAPSDDISTTISEFVTEYPHDERLTGCLMRALHASGHTPDAIATYHQLRNRLRRTYGISPGQHLRRLYESLLARETPTPAHGTPPPPRPHTDNLHHDIADFTDRRHEIARLTTVPEEHRGIHVVHGLPGVGKTALALHTAHRLRPAFDTRLYLSLRGQNDQARLEPAEALQELLAMVGVPGKDLPASIEQRSALWRDRIAERRALLILDDVTTPDQVRPLLPGSPHTLVLLTSRRRLSALDGAHHIPLDPPPASEAAQLFTAVSGRDHGAEADQVATIVELCDRLPLALRLTGTWLRNHPTWSLDDLYQRLTRTGNLIHNLPSPISQRLAAVLTLALNDLSPPARATLVHLASLPTGEVNLHAVAALTAMDLPSCESALEELMDYHLLHEASPYRYRLTGLVELFAREHSRRELSLPHRHAAHHRLLEYYLCAYDAADRALSPDRVRLTPHLIHHHSPPTFATPADAAQWLLAERFTMLATIRWAHQHHALQDHAARLTHAAGAFLHTYGPWNTAAELHRQAIEHWRARSSHNCLAYALIDYGRCLLQLSDFDGALSHMHEARELWQALHDIPGQALAAHQIGLAHAMADRFSQARPFLLLALELYEPGEHPPGRAACLNHCGICDWELGDLDSATTRFTEALHIHHAANDLLGIANVKLNLAGIHKTTGRHRDSFHLLTDALHLFRQLQDRRKEAAALGNIGILHAYKGRHQQALTYHLKALKTHRELGDRKNEATTLIDAGNAHLGLGSPTTAIQHFQSACEIAHRYGGPDTHTLALAGLAAAHADLNRDDEAIAHFTRSLSLAESNELPLTHLDILLKQTRFLLSRNRIHEAKESLAKAKQIGSKIQDPQRQSEIEILAESIRGQTGDES